MIRKQPNSAMVPGIGPISFDDLTERGAVAARGDEQHHKVLHRPRQHHAAQQPQCAGQVADLRGQHRPHQRPGAGDGGEVVAEQHVLVGRHVVQAVVVDHRRSGAAGVQLHHLGGDVQAVVAVGHQIHRHRSDDDPQRADVFAAAQRHHAEAGCAEYPQQHPRNVL